MTSIKPNAFQAISQRISWRSWVLSGLVLLAFIGYFVWLARTGPFLDALKNVQIRFVVWAVVFWLVEAAFAIVRQTLFFAGPNRWQKSMEVSAWHFLLQFMLPARLGDVAWLWLANNRFPLGYAPISMIMLIMRLMDILILGVFCLIASFWLVVVDMQLIVLAASIVITLLVIGFCFLSQILAIIARMLAHLQHRRFGAWLYRFIIRQRLWLRHKISMHTLLLGLILTIIKWLMMFVTFLFAMKATGIHEPIASALSLASLYNFMAAVPLNAIGGFGFNDLGLMGMLSVLGYSAALGATAIIVLRFCLIAGPVCLALAVLALAPLMRRLLGR